MVSERDPALRLVPRQTLHDHAYGALREAILEGRLAPGERLVEVELCLSLGISRGPLREAMRQLESEGLVVRRSHQGTHVVRPTGRDIVELYGVRAALEGFAASEALDVLRSTAVPRMRLELAALDMAAQARDWSRVARLDADWHSHIVTAAGNRHLERQWLTANGPLRILYTGLAARVYEPDQVVIRHAELLDTLAAASAEEVERAVRAHYLDTARHFARYIDESPSDPIREPEGQGTPVGQNERIRER